MRENTGNQGLSLIALDKDLQNSTVLFIFFNLIRLCSKIVNPLNEIAPEKISVTPTKLSTASEIHGVKQLTLLNRNKDSKICLRNNVKLLNEKSHPIDRIINKCY